MAPFNLSYLEHILARKEAQHLKEHIAHLPDSLEAWIACYLGTTIVGVRDEGVTKKIALHLGRFHQFIKDNYGHERISTVLKRDVLRWRKQLDEELGLARSTTNNHLASLSGFTTWVHAQRPDLFAMNNPCAGVGELPLPALEPEALSKDQVMLLKNLCDRLPRLHEHTGRRYQKQRRQGLLTEARIHTHARPYRDRALILVLLSTGLRREELVRVNLDQVEPSTPEELRKARRARITNVHGKGKSMRILWLSVDARAALSDYLERERQHDVETFVCRGEATDALFLRASSVVPAKPPLTPERGGRMSIRTVNSLVSRIGDWYNAELEPADPRRIRGKLHPHMLRHTFAFLLAEETKADTYELERRLGHRSQRYIARYTNPPEEVAAKYVEKL